MSAAHEDDFGDVVPLRTSLETENWSTFSANSTADIPMLVTDLWPESAVGFIGAPPKKGKTWLALSLAISVSTGTPFLGKFQVPRPRPVLLLALEGHRAAIRGRIGCLARGQGIDPDTPQLDQLHIAYKPAGIDLSDPAWILRVRNQVSTLGAAILIVDVLRAAATLKENDNSAFSAFINKLRPITADGCSLGINHHFGKLTELTKDRTPGERMAGAGAMYGAFDVGIFITGSEHGARNLRVEFETRDLASPETLGLRLAGDATGRNGGFVYHDIAYWKIEEAPDEADVTANAAEVRAWLEQQPEQSATEAEIAYAFECSDKTVKRRRPAYAKVGIEYTPKVGKRPGFYRLCLDTDTPDNVHTTPMSAHLQGNLVDKTLSDKTPCPDEKTWDLQGLSRLDMLDTPTECVYTVSGDAPEPERLAYLEAIRPDDQD